MNNDDVLEIFKLNIFDDVYLEYSVIKDYRNQIRFDVDEERPGHPYFKVYNSTTLKKFETKIARLHFKDSSMEYHSDEYLDWIITNKDVKLFKEILNDNNRSEPYCTNWQLLCYRWNTLNRIIPEKFKYFNGEYDNKNSNNPLYVSSIQEMPETWYYNINKAKNKRRGLQDEKYL
jgi:hypothetical protein